MKVNLEFEPRDLWLGVFFAHSEPAIPWTRRVYICLVPCFPIVISWYPAVRM